MTIMINKYEMTHNNPPNPMSVYYYSERGSFLPNSSILMITIEHPSLTRPPPNEGRSHVRNNSTCNQGISFSQQQHRDLQTCQQQETQFILPGNLQHVTTLRLASDRLFEREDKDSHNQLEKQQRTHVTISELIGMLVNVDEIVCVDTSGRNVDTSDTLNRQASIEISCRLVPHHRQQVIHDSLTN